MLKNIDGKTKIFGILGHPVGHSLSPLLHNTAFQSSGFNGVYVPFDVPHPDTRTKESFLKLGIQGLSVTIPHKSWAYMNSDRRDSLSEICKASNTLIRMNDDAYHAYNTDGPGALNALYTQIESLKGKNILILGYGGSASAIAHAILLNDPPSSLLIAGRNEEKIQNFIRSLSIHKDCSTRIAMGDEGMSSGDVDIIINTTPLGMKSGIDELPLHSDLVSERHIVFDIVYIPRDTPLVRLARSRNARIVYGHLMLLHQAVLQFKLFTGEEAPVKLMEEVLLDALKYNTD